MGRYRCGWCRVAVVLFGLGVGTGLVGGTRSAGAVEKASDAEKRAEQLVAKLGSKDGAVRRQAYEGLASLGELATKALAKAAVALRDEGKRGVLARELLRRLVIERKSLPVIGEKGLVRWKPDPKAPGKGDPNLLYDKKRRLIVARGEFCLEVGALEYLICSRGPDAKRYETVAVVDIRPLDLSWVLLLCGYTYFDELVPGKVVKKLPPKAGISVSVEFEWKPLGAKKGRLVRLPLEAFIWNAQTGKTMKNAPLVFTGSKSVRDKNRNIYMADVECLVAALKFDPNAVLNSPLDTNQFDPDSQACYEINQRIIPPRGTKCRVIFEPYKGPALLAKDLKDSGDKAKGQIGRANPRAGMVPKAGEQKTKTGGADKPAEKKTSKDGPGGKTAAGRR